MALWNDKEEDMGTGLESTPRFQRPMPDLQLVRLDHAPALLAFEQENRAYFAASIPDRGDEFFTEFDMRLAQVLERQAHTSPEEGGSCSLSMHHVCLSWPTRQGKTGRSRSTTSRDTSAGRFLCPIASFALFGCTESDTAGEVRLGMYGLRK